MKHHAIFVNFEKAAQFEIVLFVWFESLHPVNNLSVIKGWVFPGWTSTKLGLMFLLKDHNAVRLEPAAFQALYLWAPIWNCCLLQIIGGASWVKSNPRKNCWPEIFSEKIWEVWCVITLIMYIHNLLISRFLVNILYLVVYRVQMIAWNKVGCVENWLDAADLRIFVNNWEQWYDIKPFLESDVKP